MDNQNMPCIIEQADWQALKDGIAEGLLLWERVFKHFDQDRFGRNSAQTKLLKAHEALTSIAQQAALEASTCAHVWNDFGQLGGRKVSWCPRCDTLAWTGKEPTPAPQQAAVTLKPIEAPGWGESPAATTASVSKCLNCEENTAVNGKCTELYQKSGASPEQQELDLKLALQKLRLEHPSLVHPDQDAVRRFAMAMESKMSIARGRGRSGWDDPAQCPIDLLQDLLRGHLLKGDPVDVANFCMMLWNRGAEAVCP